MNLGDYGEVLVWTSVTFIGGFLTLMLPKMPKSLPDTITHMMFLDTEDEHPEVYEENQNTQL